MKLPYYKLNADSSLHLFEFTSVGPKGKIDKIILFEKSITNDVYNLAFGDRNNKTGEIDDEIVSNNGDSFKILRTVVEAITIFTNKYPTKWIYAEGSTKSRTRLYRMGISNNLNESRKHFIILGNIEGQWEYFQPNKEYISFAILKKIN
jgi:hypothetical protein